LGKLILLATCSLSFLMVLYAASVRRGCMRCHFFSWFLLTLGFACGAVLTAHLLSFLVCWGILGITLYQLIPKNSEASAAAA
jgi:NADH:ubiquinone oxidoreductase subunit 5 (subunit L)/multisubunit Na+/H+ antiporter MnhA subunit